MARCTNCGREIPEEDKTRLCEDCKRIILPFIKFMDGSDTPAVKRLLSNEKNLRSAGVTDSGMDYLYRICELRDRKAQNARESKENSSTAAAFGTPDPTGAGVGAGVTGAGKKKITAQSLPAAQSTSDELLDFTAGRKTNPKPAAQPEDEQNGSGSGSAEIGERTSARPEAGEETPVGRALPAAQWIMILAGTASLVWFGAKILTRTFVGESLTDSIDVGALAAALSSYSGAYVAGAVRKALRRFEP